MPIWSRVASGGGKAGAMMTAALVLTLTFGHIREGEGPEEMEPGSSLWADSSWCRSTWTPLLLQLPDRAAARNCCDLGLQPALAGSELALRMMSRPGTANGSPLAPHSPGTPTAWAASAVSQNSCCGAWPGWAGEELDSGGLCCA